MGLGKSVRCVRGIALVVGFAALAACDGGSGGTKAPQQSCTPITSVQAEAALLGRSVTRRGKAKVLAVNSITGTTAIHYYLEDNAGARHELSFTDSAPALQTGDEIEVSGSEVPGMESGLTFADPIVTSSAQTTSASAVAALSSTFGAQSTLAILVSFSDLTTNYTLTGLQDVVFNQVNGFWQEASYGKTWITGQAVGPFKISEPSTNCNPDTIASEALAAASASGVNTSQYTHYVFVFPQNSCGWLGLATIGGNPSEAWINGAMQRHTLSHEMGHNLGLYHAKAWDCGTSAILVGSCNSIEYGDPSSAMGNKLPGHYNAYQKEQLGWLGGSGVPPINLVQTDGDYPIDVYETNNSNVKALKIARVPDPTTGEQKYYYVEYRQSVGYDSVFGNISYPSNITSGVLVHSGSATNPDSSYLLNMNPASQSFYLAALNVGESYQDPYSGIGLTLVSANSSQAVVHVGFTAPTATPPPSSNPVTACH